MKYETIKKYSDDQFRQITGVKRPTFEKMVEILRAKLREKLSKGGRKPTLTLEERKQHISPHKMGGKCTN
ncbi:hypothetical protein FACS1894171_0850 [Clostridia bacterium]|nr:hypothetical protein FACS1894171_0850 [Clostridia bacterium]